MDDWLPDGRLAGLDSGYQFDAVDPGPGHRHHWTCSSPAWANMRFHVEGSHWRVRIGAETFDVPRASLFGPTSRAGYSESGKGAVIGAGITPLGWYRLTRRPAADFADHVSPLAELLGNQALALHENLASAGPDAVKPALDAFFLKLLAEPRSDESRVAEIHGYLMAAGHGGVGEMADRIGLSHRTLNRIALAAFGFGAKLLVRRARFLRSLMALTRAENEAWSSRIEGSYYDHSHFDRETSISSACPRASFCACPSR